MFLNRSQRQAYDKIIELGRAKFSATLLSVYLSITPRFTPLMYGPTGAGKTFVAELVSKNLHAKFMSISIADWIPEGAREGTHTMKALLDTLVEYDRTVLFLDEIDKLTTGASAWERSVMAEVWEAIDMPRKKPNLFIIGAGTWQDEHDRKTPGFVQQSRPLEFKGTPKELLYRFSHAIAVNYPTPDETREIFRVSGLQELADKVGHKINPETHVWDGGMRSIEVIATELILIYRQQQNKDAGRVRELLAKCTRPWTGTIPRRDFVI